MIEPDKGGTSRKLIFVEPEFEAAWWAWDLYSEASKARKFRYDSRKWEELASLLWEMAIGEKGRDLSDHVTAIDHASDQDGWSRQLPFSGRGKRETPRGSQRGDPRP